MRLNSPNDSAWHSNGWLYFTDPPYGLALQEDDPSRELEYNGIYRLSPGGEIQLLERDQTRPNGIAFSPDQETLYVANSDGANKVWYAYDVMTDGTISNPRVFYDVNDQDTDGAADGMKVDVSGNIFATGPGGVWIFDPEGNHLGTIRPDEVPANVAWGDDGATLYMTARTGLYRIRLNTQGNIL
jgi:gluconolactonase